MNILKLHISCLLIALFCISSNQAGFLDDVFNVKKLTPTVEDVVQSYRYPFELHHTQTDDGFTLAIFRIPYGKNDDSLSRTQRQPVFVQHGLLVDGTSWLFMRNHSLPFLLADRGYDVWIGNFRGTEYSSQHNTSTPDQHEYWKWTWDELAAYDLTAFLKYVGKITNQVGNILYVGHSMGTTSFFSLMSSKPEYNKYVKAIFALAPIVYLNNMYGPFRAIIPYNDLIKKTYDIFHIGEIIPIFEKERVKKNIPVALFMDAIEKAFRFVLTVCAFNLQLNDVEYRFYSKHFPAPESIWAVHHYSQLIKSGNFTRYDYGLIENMKRYSSPTPPAYKLEEISVPVSLYCGPYDYFAALVDVDRFWQQIRNKFAKYLVPLKTFGHLDFLVNENVKELVYDQLLSDMSTFS